MRGWQGVVAALLLALLATRPKQSIAVGGSTGRTGRSAGSTSRAGGRRPGHVPYNVRRQWEAQQARNRDWFRDSFTTGAGADVAGAGASGCSEYEGGGGGGGGGGSSTGGNVSTGSSQTGSNGNGHSSGGFGTVGGGIGNSQGGESQVRIPGVCVLIR